MDYAIAVIFGYLLGSVAVARIVAGRHGVDLHETADGNPGAWNALQQLGGRRAWPAFAGDGLKGLVAGVTGLALGGWWVAWAAVAAAMVGHAVPVFARGRGGKSVMCFAGGVFALAPLAGLICLSLTVAISARRGFAQGARAGVLAVPVVELGTGPISHVQATGVLMTLIGVLFILRRRPGRATGAMAAEPRS